jgi:hypothetical protein
MEETMRAIIEPAQMASGGIMPGLFNVLILDTDEEFRDLGVRQVEALIRDRQLVPAAA